MNVAGHRDMYNSEVTYIDVIIAQIKSEKSEVIGFRFPKQGKVKVECVSRRA